MELNSIFVLLLTNFLILIWYTICAESTLSLFYLLSEMGFFLLSVRANYSSHSKCNFNRFCGFREESIYTCGRSKLTDHGVLAFRFAREIKSVRILALTDSTFYMYMSKFAVSCP